MPTRAAQYASRGDNVATTLATGEGFSLYGANRVGGKTSFVTLVNT